MDTPQPRRRPSDSDSSTPRVTVVVPCHLRAGRETFVAAAVRSVLGQTFGDFELILVDDASVVPLTTLDLPADARLRVLRHERNRGVSEARNTGWRAARGALVAFLDDDDVWLPAYLQRMVDVLDRDPEAGLVVAMVALLDEAVGVLTPNTRDGPAGRNTLAELVDYGNGPPSAFVFRKRLLDVLGGFDPELEGYADLDIVLRSAERGIVVMVHEILCHYRVHSAGMSRDDLVMGLDAIRVWQKFLARHPGQARPGGLTRAWVARKLARQHHRVARACASRGKLGDAFGHLRRAIRLWPGIGRSFSPEPTGVVGQALSLVKPYVALAGLALAITPLGVPLRRCLKPR
jgi:glycosyltransferase involved in cell wall biosynthesis